MQFFPVAEMRYGEFTIEAKALKTDHGWRPQYQIRLEEAVTVGWQSPFVAHDMPSIEIAVCVAVTSAIEDIDQSVRGQKYIQCV